MRREATPPMLKPPAFLLILAVVAGSGAQDLVVNPPAINVLKAGQWRVTPIQPKDWEGELTATVTTTQGNIDLYLRKGAAPTLTDFDAASITNNRTETVRLTNTSQPALTSDTWYIGLYARGTSFYTASNRVAQVPSSRPGNGAVPFAGGTTFRLWAPFATQANVAGPFNGWNDSNAKLVAEGGGWWSLDYRRTVPGQQYKFVLRNGSQVLWKKDPWAKALVSSNGNAIIHNPNAYAWQTNNFVTPAWNDLVVYETHIGTFNDTPGGKPGTFSTAEQKLDYLQGLGVNCIELLPVQEFPGDYSWGYNPSDPFSVESAYGGPDALKSFVDKANARGIAVLLDLVHNHYGPNDLDLWRFDGWSQGSWGGIFFYQDDRAVTPWGNTRPDFGRQEVRDYIRDNQRQWSEEFRVSGFRWDSVLNIRTTNRGDNAVGWELLQTLNNDLDQRQPWKINIAEDLQNNNWVTRETGQGGAGFDSQWSNFVHTVRAALITPDDNSRDMNAVAGAITERFNGDAWRRVIYTESHDENANGRQRVPSEIDASNPASYWAQKRSTLGAALVFTAPGIPMVFQGQEILEDGWFADNDPVDWNKLNLYPGINLLYRDLIRMRRNLGGTTAGLKGQGLNLYKTDNAAKLIAFHRYDQGGVNDDVVVLLNFKNATVNNLRLGFPNAGRWRVVFNSDARVYSPLFGDHFTPDVDTQTVPWDGLGYSALVSVAPYTAVVFARG
ncbi:MAG: alpha amylase C-terminal domain-containing protein [Fimbriimonadaceae bacterium]|nr:alpha amylase C-terminal domain-containing protein [Fimbriimonadaceae bacterium]QYK56754.1 MAG: alpha amylase C-terminal domain-containing protein [Fimbriimonadaceae bacterium]